LPVNHINQQLSRAQPRSSRIVSIPSSIMSWVLSNDIFCQLQHPFTHLSGFDDASKIIGCIFVCRHRPCMRLGIHKSIGFTNILRCRIWGPRDSHSHIGLVESHPPSLIALRTVWAGLYES
jgi:hypothetical protein